MITKVIQWRIFKNAAVKFPTSEVAELIVCLNNNRLFQKDPALQVLYLAGWSIGWSVSLLVRWVVGWFSVVWLVPSLTGWRVGWSVG